MTVCRRLFGCDDNFPLSSECALLRLANRKYRLSVVVRLFAAIAFALFAGGSLRAQCPRPENRAIVANPNRPTVADPADITQYGVLELEYGFDHANTGRASAKMIWAGC